MRHALSALAMALLLSPSFAAQENKTRPVDTLVEAERAFSRTSVQKGVKESFIEFFADDGVNFNPGPVVVKESFANQPATPQPPPIILSWEPIYADASRAGDLGYTTGPYVVTDNTAQKRPPRHGYYFSVWKRQADGAWKVVIDFGIRIPAAPAPETLRTPSQEAPKGRVAREDSARVISALMALDTEFSKASESNGAAAAYQNYLQDDARLHRNGMSPVLGRKAIADYFSKADAAFKWSPMKADVSQSADLGYTYGTYELLGKGATAAAETGYYVRVWKKMNGRWLVVMDVAAPRPPAEKKG